MPFHRERYPSDWNAISKRIREERAGNKCEWCGVQNKAYGARDRDGEFFEYERIGRMSYSEGFARFGDFPKYITIVLTVAHIDHDTTNNDDSNLAALCQRCHLRHDAKHHAQNAARTRRRKYAERTGQTSFID